MTRAGFKTDEVIYYQMACTHCLPNTQEKTVVKSVISCRPGPQNITVILWI